MCHATLVMELSRGQDRMQTEDQGARPGSARPLLTTSLGSSLGFPTLSLISYL